MKTLIIPVISCLAIAPLQAGLLETKIIQGPAPGPTIRVLVERAEKPKTMGIDKQLAGFAMLKGTLVIETHDSQLAEVPPFAGGGKVDLEVVLRWSKNAPVIKRGSGDERVSRIPQLSGTRPDVITPWFLAAAGGSYPENHLEDLPVESIPLEKTQRAMLHFPSPRAGVVRSRQFRLGRRFVGNALEAFGMVQPSPSFWPPNLDVSKLICIYDAEGCGHSGSMNLERVVNTTTLDNNVTLICHEDIRDGALNGVRAVVFPGGTASGIVNALDPAGVGNVREFVEDGGAYVGVCAGAYFSGSGNRSYARLSHLVQHQPWAKGKGMLEMELTPEGVEILGEEFKTFTNRYNNGPIYLDLGDPPAGSPFQPVINLAVFKQASTSRNVTHDVMVNASGIHATTFGKGRCINISAHPETHEELDVLVARCFGWALGVPKENITFLK